MNLRADKLDHAGVARALELEEAGPERLAWHVACVEFDNERLRVEVEQYRQDAERYRWLKARIPLAMCSAAWAQSAAALEDDVANDPDKAIDAAMRRGEVTSDSNP